jgi:hypothetical protein
MFRVEALGFLADRHSRVIKIQLSRPKHFLFHRSNIYFGEKTATEVIYSVRNTRIAVPESHENHDET